jgi:predicted N-acetyltransferase YhbS
MNRDGHRFGAAPIVRRATDADETAILELNRMHNGEEAAVEIRSAFGAGHMAPDDFAVAVAGGGVVSAVGLLPIELSVGDVVVPTGQPEFIATDPAFRGRGLVRQLLDLVHGWSADRGDLVQVIAGIPFFYRQFGYSYGLRRPVEWLVLAETEVVASEDWAVRLAQPSDIAVICALEEQAQLGATVRLPFLEGLWPVLLALPHAPVLVATAGGRVEAVTRLRTGPGRPVRLLAMAARDPGAATALIAAARTEYPGRTLVIGDRAGLSLRQVLGAAVPVARRRWLYVRIADPARLLRHLWAVFDARLAASPFASASGRIDISFYRSGAAIEYRGGRVTEVSATPRDGSRRSQADVHIPPDLLPRLLFGAGYVLDYEDDPDVDLGAHRDLVLALLPPVQSDVLVW